MKNDVVWVVGRDTYKGWGLICVCDTEEKAISFCLNRNYFVGPIEFNKPFTPEETKWAGSYYPVA